MMRQQTMQPLSTNKLTKLKNLLRSNFSKLSFKPRHLVLDPIFTSIFCCFKQVKWCKCFKRQKLIESINERFAQELDIVNLLAKVRDSHTILKNVLRVEDRNMLKISHLKIFTEKDMEEA